MHMLADAKAVQTQKEQDAMTTLEKLRESILKMLQTEIEAQRNRISLRTDFAEDLPQVMGDKVQVQQVILNLLVNAIQALSV